MHPIRLLTPRQSASFAALTFPRYRHLLGNDKPLLVAVGAEVLGRPSGLALGWYNPKSETQTARVFSVQVTASYRRKGLGAALLARLEAELAERGAERVTGEFPDDRPATAATRALLDRSEWDEPRLDRLVCMTDLATIVEAPWMHDYVLPDGFEIFPWSELSEDEAARVAEWDHTQGREGEWDERGLATTWRPNVPFEYNSMGLRRGGEVVGWMLTDRVAPDTLRYDRLYVKHELRTAGLGVMLLAASIWANDEAEGHLSPSRRGVWQTLATNRPMIAFIRRRMAPYLTSLTDVYSVSKTLPTTDRHLPTDALAEPASA